MSEPITLATVLGRELMVVSESLATLSTRVQRLEAICEADLQNDRIEAARALETPIEGDDFVLARAGETPARDGERPR